MLQVTDPAARNLKWSLLGVTELDEPRLRLGIVKDSIKCAVDRERPGDTTVRHRGQSLIVMDPVTSTRLSDRKLDYDGDCFWLVAQ